MIWCSLQTTIPSPFTSHHSIPFHDSAVPPLRYHPQSNFKTVPTNHSTTPRGRNLSPYGAALKPLSLLLLVHVGRRLSEFELCSEFISKVVEWWFGGCTKSCLCVSFSVGLVMISSLGYVGVHEDNNHHGRSCARAFGFSIENVVRSLVFEQKIKVVLARKT